MGVNYTLSFGIFLKKTVIHTTFKFWVIWRLALEKSLWAFSFTFQHMPPFRSIKQIITMQISLKMCGGGWVLLITFGLWSDIHHHTLSFFVYHGYVLISLNEHCFLQLQLSQRFHKQIQFKSIKPVATPQSSLWDTSGSELKPLLPQNIQTSIQKRRKKGHLSLQNSKLAGRSSVVEGAHTTKLPNPNFYACHSQEHLPL